MRTWLTGVLLAILAALGAGAGLAVSADEQFWLNDEEWEKADTRKFLEMNDLWEKYRDVKATPANVIDNIAQGRALSTKDYLVFATRDKSEILPQHSRLDWDVWRVVSISPGNFGAVVCRCEAKAFPDNQQAIRGYCDYWSEMTNRGPWRPSRGMKRNDALRLGDWALCRRNLGPEKIGPRMASVEFCRNGVVVVANGKDCDGFHYLSFLRGLDAALRREPGKPAPEPTGLSEAEYRRNVEQYRAWLKEKEKEARESEKPEPPRVQPVIWWHKDAVAAGEEFMGLYFPDSPEDLGTWRAGYAAAPENPARKRVTLDAFRACFPIVDMPDGKRDDYISVIVAAKSDQPRSQVIVLHARSALEAREGLAWLCLTHGHGYVCGNDDEPPRFQRYPLGIGDFCLGDLLEEGHWGILDVPHYAYLFFLWGNTAVMVHAPSDYALEIAKWLDGLFAVPPVGECQ